MSELLNLSFDDFEKPIRAVVIGASGGIGKAFVTSLAEHESVNSVYACSRSGVRFENSKIVSLNADITDEESLKKAATKIEKDGEVNLVIVATGTLHENSVQPEKSFKDMSLANFNHLFLVNSAGPALAAKHFLPLIPRDQKSVFAMLSARVGSISDNRLGGWYAYRASKAALNMIIKNLAIEVARKNKQAVVAGLHPGTVDTDLSKPFQANVPEGKLFTPEYSARMMLNVLSGLSPEDSGKIFDYAGEEVLP
ncbi:MAG: SDR family NAD(P)-dependent oxidoreductase [Alphaproteobacteria bacterium]|nr:SDR family NAD(P)-dependent oxidoreductase [Alphaproteobacteria bacterium]